MSGRVGCGAMPAGGGRQRLRRPDGDRRQRLGPLRHLHEGHRHRGARLGRPHERLHGAGRPSGRSAATPAMRLATRIYEARLYVRGAVKSLGADCVEKPMRAEHKAELRGRCSSKPRSAMRRRRVPPFGSARRSIISTSTTPASTEDAMNRATAPIPPTAPRNRRRSTIIRITEIKTRRARPASTTFVVAAPSAAAAFRRSVVSRRLASRAIRSKDIASDAAPTSCSAHGSPSGRSSSRYRSPSPA